MERERERRERDGESPVIPQLVKMYDIHFT